MPEKKEYACLRCEDKRFWLEIWQQEEAKKEKVGLVAPTCPQCGSADISPLEELR